MIPVTWPWNICLLILCICTCEHYIMALQQNTSNLNNVFVLCSYFPCGLKIFLYTCPMNTTQQYLSRNTLNWFTWPFILFYILCTSVLLLYIKYYFHAYCIDTFSPRLFKSFEFVKWKQNVWRKTCRTWI